MGFFVGAFIFFISVEYLAPQVPNEKIKNWFWICANLIIFPALIPTINKLFNYGLNLISMPTLLNLSEMQLAWQFLWFLLILDFIKYVHHYCLHHFDFLWKIHSVHHSSTSIDVTASFKISWFESITAIFISCLLGRLIHVDESLVLLTSYLIYFVCLWQHTNIDYTKLKLNFSRKLFITPLTHRIHHERLPGMKHRNLGLIFSFWDRIFGTYRDAPINSVFGIESDDYPYESDFRQFLYPFGSTKTSKTR